MKIFIFLLTLTTFNAFALDAVITVLEAPLFKEKDINSDVVQYFRKGDVIKIHPSVGKNHNYDDLSPSNEQLASIKKKLKDTDPLFSGVQDEDASISDEFIPMLDRTGHKAYILSKHIYVYFDDAREFKQTVNKQDPTDYRISEPLPKDYPFYTDSGYRGLALLGLSQPYNESYPYPDRVKTKGYTSPYELQAGLLWQVPYDTRDRFFFGASFKLRSFENDFSFFDFRQSVEKYLQFGLGPMISFDAYKGEKNRLNLSFGIHFNPFNQIKITQSDDKFTETRTYRAFNFSSRLGVYYHRKSIGENLDFIMGTSLDFEPYTNFQAQDGGSQNEWWQNIGGDKFTTRPYFSMTASLGLQAAY
jgi:hypothetical protein